MAYPKLDPQPWVSMVAGFPHLFPTKSITSPAKPQVFVSPPHALSWIKSFPNSFGSKAAGFLCQTQADKASVLTSQARGLGMGWGASGKSPEGRAQNHTALTQSPNSFARSFFLTAFGQFPVPLNGCFQQFCPVLYLLFAKGKCQTLNATIQNSSNVFNERFSMF